MTRWFIALLLLCLSPLLGGDPAEASADSRCYPEWRADGGRYCANVALLSPHNDSRTNLALLLADRRLPGPVTAYPDELWDEEQGRTFATWAQLVDLFFPDPAQAKDAPEEFGDDDFSGSICQSFESGAADFLAALADERALPASEQAALTTLRTSLYATCAGAAYAGWEAEYIPEAVKARLANPWPAQLPPVASQSGRAFLAYLLGTKAFYEADFLAAHGHYTRLLEAKAPKRLTEMAIYMVARTELNRAQANAFGEWGDFAGTDAVDQQALDNAERVFNAYVKAYPAGRYTASASGLMRRVMWLRGDMAGLGGVYQQQLATQPLEHVGAMIQELDNILLFEDGILGRLDDPDLIAVVVMVQLRNLENDYGDAPPPPIDRAAIEALAPKFAQRQELYELLLASHAFYVANNPKEVLQLIPDAARQENFSYLQFSRQGLRGLALKALGDRNEAGFWRDMLSGSKASYQRPFVELALAQAMEKQGAVDAVFANGSPITDRTIREILLQQAAPPELLRRIAAGDAASAHEQQAALFTLLYKQLTRGQYADFVRDSALLPAGAPHEGYVWLLHVMAEIPLGRFGPKAQRGDFNCPDIRSVAAMLARDAKDYRGRLCLGDYIRTNGFDDYSALDTRPPADQLGGAAPPYPAAYRDRHTFYTDIIADPRAPADVKAYALFRAVNCYAPGGNNSCRGKAVETGQRRAWFQQLKRDYPRSPWAQKLRYFW